MLECPFCGGSLSQQGRDNWMECPNCGNLVRRRINRNGIVWLEAGVVVNGNIQPVQVPSRMSQPVQPARLTVQAPTSNFPSINTMDLPAVQAERRQIEIRLRELEVEIQRVYRLRSQSPASGDLRRYNTELGQYTSEQNRLQDRDQRLQERAATLEAEQARARQSGGSGPAIAFVYGSLLAIGTMYALTRAINLTLDPRAIGIAAVIAVAAGFLTFLIALFL